MATEAKVTAVIEAKDNASSTLQRVGGNFASFAAKATVIGAGALAAYKGLQAVVEASADAQVKIAAMDATLKAAGDTTKATRDAILSASQAFIKLGFDDEEAAKSMALMFQRTKDVAMSQKLATAAADLARAKNIELGDATKLVALALSGSGRALKQYGIELDETATATDVLTAIQDAAGGQAVAYASTLKGQAEVATQAWDNVKQFFGDQLIPTIQIGMGKAIEVIMNFTDWIGKAWARVMDFLETSGLLMLWKTSWENISNTFTTYLMPALERLWEALKPLQPYLEAFAVVVGATLLGAIVLLTKAIEVMAVLLTALLTAVTNVATFFVNVWKGAIDLVSDSMDRLVSLVKTAVEWISKLSLESVGKSVSNAVKSVSKSVGTSIKSVLPSFDQGGYVGGPVGAPQLAVVHGGEYVVPAGQVGRGFGNISVVITGNTISNSMDLQDITERVGNELMRQLRQAQRV